MLRPMNALLVTIVRRAATVLLAAFLSLGMGSAPVTTLSPGAPTPHPDAWRWPLPGAVTVLRPFDPPAQRWLAGHRGVDLAAQPPQQVLAPQRGRITFTGTVVDRPVMVIDHGYGYTTSLEPLEATLKEGDWVEAGAKLGELATGAHCSARCLHWGVRLNGEYIDPALLISDQRPSILLPWDAWGGKQTVAPGTLMYARSPAPPRW